MISRNLLPFKLNNVRWRYLHASQGDVNSNYPLWARNKGHWKLNRKGESISIGSRQRETGGDHGKCDLIRKTRSSWTLQIKTISSNLPGCWGSICLAWNGDGLAQFVDLFEGTLFRQRRRSSD